MTSIYRTIRISGTRSERSRQYGELARTEIHATRAGYERAFASAGVSWAEARAYARGFLPSIEAHLPEILVEIRGIAEGSGLEVDDVLALNCRTEILHRATVAGARPALARAGECTSVAVEADRSASGRSFVAQNWDWLEYLQPGTIILQVERPDGPNYVSVVEAGLLAKVCLTASGIALGVNTLVSSLDGPDSGVPFHFAIRAVLDAPNIAGAVETLAAIPRASSGNYILGHASGAVLNVEASPGGPANLSVQVSTSGHLVHANHFLDPVAGGHDLAAVAMSDSFVRYGRVQRALSEHRGLLDDDAVTRALSDHAEHPNSVCCHPDLNAEASKRWKTLASVILDPRAGCLSLAAGPPCESSWSQHDFSIFLRPREGKITIR
ncbi:C45 family autoproteolytic acyltransferase/hydolase [Leucobacter luti]|uniref:C45 family autoproteolytic acyltransferase/hydolase n=1 Tax=Leucobacter luti TaxID=340320 RepID=UPI003D090E8A